MPRKIKRMGENQTLLFVIEEPSKPEAYNRSDAILPDEWQAPIPKRSYRLGSLADKIRKGLWLECPNCGTEDIEFVSEAAGAWLGDKEQLKCPVCGGEVNLE